MDGPEARRLGRLLLDFRTLRSSEITGKPLPVISAAASCKRVIVRYLPKSFWKNALPVNAHMPTHS